MNNLLNSTDFRHKTMALQIGIGQNGSYAVFAETSWAYSEFGQYLFGGRFGVPVLFDLDDNEPFHGRMEAGPQIVEVEAEIQGDSFCLIQID